MLYEFQFSKLCLKHTCPPLNVNTPETWLLLPAGSMVTQPALRLHWGSRLGFWSSLCFYPQGLQLALGGGRCSHPSDDVTLYMVTAMHQQKAKLADAQLPA